MNYLASKSVSKEEFDQKKIDYSLRKDATLTSKEDIKKIELILDLSPGILDGQSFSICCSIAYT